MTPALIVAAFAILALAYVAAPLRKRTAAGVEPDATIRSELEGRKRVALGALVDIEDERDLGKLAEPDFEALRDEYERQALAALAELDAYATTQEDDELELEIAEVRRQLTCPSCGSLRAVGERCPRCGA